MLCELIADTPQLYKEQIRYVALSHCWGTEQVVTTTNATRFTFQQDGIPWSHLSKTFREAIGVTCALGIDYIWIDSLCIVQDNIEDWAHEASRMADIFSNAYLTLGATGSKNGNEGLINRHKIHKITRAHNGVEYTVCVRDTVDHELREANPQSPYTNLLTPRKSTVKRRPRKALKRSYYLLIGVEHSADPFPDKTKFALRERAWCLQEDLLSRRFVHFTKDEIVYVCRMGTICECHQSWLPRFKVPGLIDEQDQERGPQTWWDILAHFSKRQISFHHDRLPAISSLATTFKNSSGKYLAGFWESDLPFCLLWWTDCGYRSHLPTHEKSSPPSWSWASVEGGEICQGLGLTEVSTAYILDAAVYRSTNDPKGLVLGGHVILRAPLLPIRSTWQRHLDEDQNHEWNINLYPTWLQNDREDGIEEGDPGNAEYCHCSLDDIGNMRPLPENGSFDPPVSLLVLGTWDYDFPEQEFARVYEGLLVQPLPVLSDEQRVLTERWSSELVCVRIGLGMLWLTSNRRQLPQDFDKTVTIF